MTDNTDIMADFNWVLECNKTPPDIKFLEPTIQSISLLYALKNNDALDDQDLVKLALSGYVTMRCRLVDEERFKNIDPHLYLQIAQLLAGKYYEGFEDVFENFIEKIKS